MKWIALVNFTYILLAHLHQFPYAKKSLTYSSSTKCFAQNFCMKKARIKCWWNWFQVATCKESCGKLLFQVETDCSLFLHFKKKKLFFQFKNCRNFSRANRQIRPQRIFQMNNKNTFKQFIKCVLLFFKAHKYNVGVLILSFLY